MSAELVSRCACCRTLHFTHPETAAGRSYCERCEVAYLEFKLGLLVLAWRGQEQDSERG